MTKPISIKDAKRRPGEARSEGSVEMRRRVRWHDRRNGEVPRVQLRSGVRRGAVESFLSMSVNSCRVSAACVSFVDGPKSRLTRGSSAFA
jgi:hypothetical protein